MRAFLLAAAAAVTLPTLAFGVGDQPAAPPASGYSSESAYVGSGDVSARETWLEDHIHAGQIAGALSDYHATQDFRELMGIRRHQALLAAAKGGVTAYDRKEIEGRLDNLTAQVATQWNR